MAQEKDGQRGAFAINRVEANELWVELYARKGIGWLPVLTDSMAPLIRSGDQVLVSQVLAEQIHFGDIVVFRRNGDLIVHRVFKKWRNAEGIFFGEKGDSAQVQGLLAAGKVIGRVTTVKGRGNKTLSLSPPLSRLANLVLSAWLYWTTAGIMMLRSSRSKTAKRAGKVLSPLLMLSSRILVRTCFAIWYLAALLSR
ncbi:S24/S26 family peptidase [Chloroflexota bacterium]